MTTVIINNIPDEDKTFLAKLASIAEEAGYEVSVTNDDDFSESEFAMLASGFKEALLIKEGKVTPIHSSKLWND
jgi:hypothetical protein